MQINLFIGLESLRKATIIQNTKTIRSNDNTDDSFASRCEGLLSDAKTRELSKALAAIWQPVSLPQSRTSTSTRWNGRICQRLPQLCRLLFLPGLSRIFHRKHVSLCDFCRMPQSFDRWHYVPSSGSLDKSQNCEITSACALVLIKLGTDL